MKKTNINKPLLTPKQSTLLSNLAEAPGSKVGVIRKYVVADFRGGNEKYTKDHVALSMLRDLALRGYCYYKKESLTAAKLWYPTELGVLTLINVIGERNGEGDYRRCTAGF